MQALDGCFKTLKHVHDSTSGGTRLYWVWLTMTQWNNLLSSPLKWELLFGWFSNEHFLSIIYRQQTAFPNIFTECLNKHANKTKINRKGEQWWHATWLGVVIFYTSLSLTRWAGCRQEAGYGSSEFFTAGSPLDIMGGTQTALTFAFATPGEINDKC